MSGMPGKLANDATQQMTDINEKRLTRKAILILLDSQMVTSPQLPSRVCKVKLGSGMGLIQSGDVTDAALASKSEVAWAANKAIQK